MCTARSSSHCGVCLSACWDTHPQVWTCRHPPPGCGPGHTHPPRVWAWRPTPLDVSLETNPSGCGPGDSPSLGLETPLVWAWEIPPGVGLETPPVRPLNFPLGCGPGNLQGIPHTPPEICKVCWDTTLSPCGQNSWHTLLKILSCPKLRLRAVKTIHSTITEYATATHYHIFFINTKLNHLLFCTFYLKSLITNVFLKSTDKIIDIMPK